jgi:hypothetical protein
VRERKSLNGFRIDVKKKHGKEDLFFFKREIENTKRGSERERAKNVEQ